MPRSIKKGPFVDESLLKKAREAQEKGDRKAIKTWSRRSLIIPEFVGLTFAVHNGTKFVPIYVTEKTSRFTSKTSITRAKTPRSCSNVMTTVPPRPGTFITAMTAPRCPGTTPPRSTI